MIVALLVALFVKHFVLDFLYQPAYQWQNKGTYGHWGGLVHSGQHALATFLILLGCSLGYTESLMLAAFEFLVHYHMDWFKMWYNSKKGWKCNTHNEFWLLTGLDQTIHSLTYVAIVSWLVLKYQ